MTTRTELLEIIASGENSGVEFKRDDLRTQDLAKELVAFSNLEGGMALLGVEDDGTVTGLTRDDLEEWVMNVCRDKIRPAIVPFFEVVSNVKDNHDIAIVRVTRGYGVHALWHNNTNRYLVRVGTQSREASQEELARLFQQRGSVRAECGPCRAPRSPTWTGGGYETISAISANRMCPPTKMREHGSHCSSIPRL